MPNKLSLAIFSAFVFVLMTGFPAKAATGSVSILETNVIAHTVNVFLSIGHQSANLDANFNGYANGHLVISIPVGYKVILHVVNDGGIPYGAGVYTDSQGVAFSGSATAIADLENNPNAGIMPGDAQKLIFTVNQIGEYRLESLLYRFPTHHPTHVSLGMWARFKVVSSGIPSAYVL